MKMKFFAGLFLLPTAIYWAMFVFHNFTLSEGSFADKVIFSLVKQAIMSLFVGLPLWGWFRWGLK
jgi:hypothetical protein